MPDTDNKEKNQSAVAGVSSDVTSQPAVPGEAGPGGEPARNPNFKWYIIHAYSGFERKVRESLESRIQAFGLQNRIGRIMIPTEPVTELRNGKKYTIERVFLPGYRSEEHTSQLQ